MNAEELDIYSKWGNYIPTDLRKQFEDDSLRLQSLQDRVKELEEEIGRKESVIKEYDEIAKDQNNRIKQLEEALMEEMEFIKWYSGMDLRKINSARTRFIKEKALKEQ